MDYPFITNLVEELAQLAHGVAFILGYVVMILGALYVFYIIAEFVLRRWFDLGAMLNAAYQWERLRHGKRQPPKIFVDTGND